MSLRLILSTTWDDVDKTLSEITRVLKKKRDVPLDYEINHPPTPTEPHTLTKHLIDRLSHEFTPVIVKLNAISE